MTTKITKAKAKKLLGLFKDKYPDLFSYEANAEEYAPKLSAREAKLLNARSQGRRDGYDEARREFEQRLEKEKEKVETTRTRLKIEALKQTTECFHSFGQMMNVLVEAMKSEANQL